MRNILASSTFWQQTLCIDRTDLAKKENDKKVTKSAQFNKRGELSLVNHQQFTGTVRVQVIYFHPITFMAWFATINTDIYMPWLWSTFTVTGRLSSILCYEPLYHSWLWTGSAIMKYRISWIWPGYGANFQISIDEHEQQLSKTTAVKEDGRQIWMPLMLSCLVQLFKQAFAWFLPDCQLLGSWQLRKCSLGIWPYLTFSPRQLKFKTKSIKIT